MNSGRATEPIIVTGQIDMAHRQYTGTTVGSFLANLKQGRIVGSRCPQCPRVYVPPRSVCIRCFTKLSDITEVGHEGSLLTYTVVRYQEPIHVYQAPFMVGLVQLDGADTGVLHYIRETDKGKARIGARVQAVFRNVREGSILDIEHFEVIG